MTLTRSTPRQRVAVQTHRGDPMPSDIQGIVESIAPKRSGNAEVDRTEIERAVLDAVQSRIKQELADLDVRRSIFHLHDNGISQRLIATLVGLSQPEVSRRLKRRELTPETPSPHEIILRRAAGTVSTREMMHELEHMAMTSATPPPAAGFDGAATSTGSAKQLATAFQRGLLTKSEYEKLRGSIRLAPASRIL